MANARCAELFGYEGPDELLGLRRSDLVSALDGESPEESSRQCADLRSRAHQITNRFGAIVPVEVSLSVVSGDRGKCLAKVIALRDVAPYRRLEVEHRVIFEAAGDGMVVYTLDGEIVAANQAFCEMNGYTCDELVGRNVATLVHPDYQELLGLFIETIGSGGSLRGRAPSTCVRTTSFPVDVHGTTYEDEGGLRILGVARDVSEEVRAYELLEERVAERTRELELVLEVSRNVASVLELEPLLTLILEQLKAVTAFHSGAILGFEDNRLVRLAGWGEGAPEAGAYGWDLDEPELAVLRQQLSQGGHVVANDLADEGLLARTRRHLVARHPQLATTAASRSWLVVPRVFAGRTIGVLSLLHAEPDFSMTTRSASCGPSPTRQRWPSKTLGSTSSRRAPQPSRSASAWPASCTTPSRRRSSQRA